MIPALFAASNALGAVLVVLKIAGVIAWPWLWILLPFLPSIGLLGFILVVGAYIFFAGVKAEWAEAIGGAGDGEEGNEMPHPGEDIAALTKERDAYAFAILAALGGIIPTPQEGYVKHGGPELAASDLRRMRKQLLVLTKERDEATATLDLISHALQQHGFKFVTDAINEITRLRADLARKDAELREIALFLEAQFSWSFLEKDNAAGVAYRGVKAALAPPIEAEKGTPSKSLPIPGMQFCGPGYKAESEIETSTPNIPGGTYTELVAANEELERRAAQDLRDLRSETGREGE